MSRFFEIITEQESRHLSDADLPLAIGSGSGAHIPLPETDSVETSAWLAESRGFYYLQIEQGETVFHNNELVTESVWIKSGDTTRFGNSFLSWTINGDRVEVRVDAVTSPEASARALSVDTQTESSGRGSLPRVDNGLVSTEKKSKFRLLAGLIFVLLVFVAGFLLFASQVEVDIQPEPDELHLSGFPPALKVGTMFLVTKGKYTVNASKDGFSPLAEQITVDGAKNHFAFTLKKLPGIVSFESTPVSGAEVFVDDKSVGTTPLENVELAPGKHLLRAERKRYLPLEREFNVTGAGHKQSVSLVLQPGWALAHLISEPPGADVSRGDEKLGKTPLNVELPVGKQVLHFSRKGYSSHELELDVVSGKELTPEPIRLDPAPAEVHLQSQPAGAAVIIGDSLKGTTPLTLHLPVSGRQKISLQLSGYESVVMQRQFKAGAVYEISEKLKPRYGRVFLTTDPVDAVLYIDGKKYGPATGRLRLTTTEHRLTIRAAGYADATQTVLPREGSSKQIAIRLEREGAGKSEGSGDGKKGVVKKSVAAGAEIFGKKDSMIRLGPATVLLGAPRREPGRRANEQQRRVRLVRPVFLASQLVTNGEFRRFKAGHRSGSVSGKTLDTDRQPVVAVSWQDAARYCNWLSKKDGLPAFYRQQGDKMMVVQPANTGYRLPTEAEWSFVARQAGRQQRMKYPWGEKFPPGAAMGNFAGEEARTILPVVIRGYTDAFTVTAPVGSFSQNPGGLFDLGGNVRQWCHDWYTTYTGLDVQKEKGDDLGPGSGTHHVVRGSSWRTGAMTGLRLSYRGYSKVGRDDIGFRVARYLK